MRKDTMLNLDSAAMLFLSPQDRRSIASAYDMGDFLYKLELVNMAYAINVVHHYYKGIQHDYA
jgi:hypothetical protein